MAEANGAGSPTSGNDTNSTTDSNGHHPKSSTAALAAGAVGVVYGDIGTSPIYALREAVKAAGAEIPLEADVLGVLSIIVWSLTLVVSVKYALFVLRADNKGEGGTLSMMALAREKSGRLAPVVLGLGMVGAALFYGDALITPAISVLSAVEGIEVVTPALSGVVIPVTIAIIVSLFAVQRYGTARVAGVFAPVMVVWFATLAGIGLVHILANPSVLRALDPSLAVFFMIENSGIAIIVIGAAFLAVTGAEALYADLGHFGRRPMVLAWFVLVFPALVINYFGQGAYVLSHGGPVGQPLFEMVPGWATLPMVILATLATIIASQATITGAFSITRQAVQLQLLPRLSILHTSESQSGQIYIPRVNWLLMIGVVWLVLEFHTSGALASAYGISVTGVMIATVVLLAIVMRRVWQWPAWLVAAVILPFAAIDLAFLWANSFKIPEGGWVSIAVAACLVAVMATWRRGSRILFDKTRRSELPLQQLAGKLASRAPARVVGTAVFLTSDPNSAPTALLHSLKHYKVLHESNVILTVVTVDRPRVPSRSRVTMETINPLFTRVELKYGYMEQPNVPAALALCRKQGLKFDMMSTSFFVSRRSLRTAPNSELPFWQNRLYVGLAALAADATEYFQIPTGRVVEIGTQVAI